MRIYFSCSLTGGRGDQPAYAALVRHLQEGGHQVLTAHLAGSEVIGQEAGMDAETVYRRDTAWVRDCEALIAEVSTPSHGVGYEIAYALERGKPVLCCHRRDVKVSRMLTGNREPGMVVEAYGEVEDLLRCADAFLEKSDIRRR
jgi:2'-deoxynucleoside 5'-phosphate N-hydrolase